MALGHVPPRLPTISFLVHFGVNLTATITSIVWFAIVACADVNNLHHQYCISHKTISPPAAAAPGDEVRHKCPMTSFPALRLLATDPGDATAYSHEICV